MGKAHSNRANHQKRTKKRESRRGASVAERNGRCVAMTTQLAKKGERDRRNGEKGLRNHYNSQGESRFFFGGPKKRQRREFKKRNQD